MQVNRRIWLGVLMLVAALAAWAAWHRRDLALGAPASRAGEPFVRLAGSGSTAADEILRERAELLDPTPLFFPTDWNYGQRSLRENRVRQRGQVFASFEPKLTIGEQNLKAVGAEATPVPETLSDVLAQGNEAPFAGMGQMDAPTSTLPIRGGYLEVQDLATGEMIIAQALSGITPPRPDFAPVEFLVVVASAGMVGDPFLVRGSEWDEVDNFFRTYLVRAYRLGERLRPGRYRVSVGA